MAFFKLGSNGQVVFGEKSKYRGKTVEEVARLDPQYLRWARRERSIGITEEMFTRIDDTMTANGVSFTQGRKRKP